MAVLQLPHARQAAGISHNELDIQLLSYTISRSTPRSCYFYYPDLCLRHITQALHANAFDLEYLRKVANRDSLDTPEIFLSKLSYFMDGKNDLWRFRQDSNLQPTA